MRADRICPGRHFGKDTIFIALASMMHVFDIIGPPLDEHGEPIEVVYGVKGEMIAHPVDCRCTIKPRSAEAEALIRGQVN